MDKVDVTVRFSDFAGIPTIADNNGLASPRGFAIKYHLDKNTATDIVCHSFNGFPSPTTADFVDLLLALSKQKSEPEVLQTYLGTHPKAKSFLTASKPMPKSYGSLPYFGVNAFKFINSTGEVVYGRYQFIPEEEAYYTADEAKNTAPNELINEIQDRVDKNPVKIKMYLQIAEKGDDLNDPSTAWPDSRKNIELGTVYVTQNVENNLKSEQELAFAAGRLTEGIEIQDPMLQARKESYPVSYKRRHEK